MGFFRRIEGLFQKPKAGSVSYTDEEARLRNQQLFEDLGKFAYEADGFTYEFSDGPQKIRWDEIAQIDAYKREHLTTDEICLDIIWQDWKMTIGEDMPGWYQFVQRMMDVFPSIPPDWEEEMMKPASPLKFVAIYKKA